MSQSTEGISFDDIVGVFWWERLDGCFGGIDSEVLLPSKYKSGMEVFSIKYYQLRHLAPD